MAKMETLFRNIVEDDHNNSLNDCTILSRNYFDDDVQLDNNNIIVTNIQADIKYSEK